ncbi:MAG: CopG family antitoxin [Limisphaerales bacterium]
MTDDEWRVARPGKWVGRRCCAARHDGRAAARPYRLEYEDEDEDEQEKSVMRTFANWEEVPIFDSEEAEAEFWVENRPDLRLMEAATAGSAEAAESVTITLRIDPRMLARIKRLARSRYLNYQSMIKQWLSERMEDELREK